MQMARTKVFIDSHGNRLIFPSFIVTDHERSKSAADVILQAMFISTAIGLKVEPEWLEFDPERLPHVVTTLCHPGFAHGGATSYVIAGPEFDAGAAEAAAEAPYPLRSCLGA